jgi:2-polyprenyl-6-methoxyphenol hydroxylase-like FAD-dependent oxidoreductase
MATTFLISGAGIGGLTLAYWLRRYGFEPTIIEHAPALRRGGYMIDFFGLGYDVAEKMNLRSKLNEHDLRIREITFVNQKNRRVGGIDAESIRELLDNRACNILRSSLSRIIYETVKDDVEIIFGNTIESIKQSEGSVQVALARGSSRTFDYLVGADGLHSNVRALVFGDESEFERYYGYYTSSFTIDNDLGRDVVFASYTAPGKQVGIYPVSDNRLATLFLFAQKGRLSYDRRDTKAQIGILRNVFSSVGWLCPQLLDRIGMAPDFYFDPVSQIRMEHWSKGRVTLVGDECYCPSLLSGQGSALAMSGSYVLAGELKAAGGDGKIAFERYENLMKPFVDDKQELAKTFAGSFLPKSNLGIWARNQFTRLMAVRPISKWFMKKFMVDRLRLKDYEGGPAVLGAEASSRAG